MLEPHVDPVVAQLPTDAVAEAVPPVGVAVGEPTTLSHGTVIQGYTAYKFCRIYVQLIKTRILDTDSRCGRIFG